MELELQGHKVDYVLMHDQTGKPLTFSDESKGFDVNGQSVPIISPLLLHTLVAGTNVLIVTINLETGDVVDANLCLNITPKPQPEVVTPMNIEFMGFFN
jgi:hypothetical protein